MTDQDMRRDETSDSLTALGKGIRNALLIEFVIGLIVWLVWRIATSQLRLPGHPVSTGAAWSTGRP